MTRLHTLIVTAGLLAISPLALAETVNLTNSADGANRDAGITAVKKKLNDACQAILAEPDFAARLASMSNEATPGVPEQAMGFISAEVARWSAVVKKANIQVQ